MLKKLFKHYVHYVICYLAALLIFAPCFTLFENYLRSHAVFNLNTIVNQTFFLLFIGTFTQIYISIIQFPCFLIFLSMTKKYPLSLSSSIIGGIFLSGSPFFIFINIIQLFGGSLGISIPLSTSLTLSGIFGGIIHYQLEKWNNKKGHEAITSHPSSE